MNHKLIITGLQAEIAKVKQELTDLQAKYDRDVDDKAKTEDSPFCIKEFIEVPVQNTKQEAATEPIVKPKRKPKPAVKASKK